MSVSTKQSAVKRFGLAVALATPLFVMSGASSDIKDPSCKADKMIDGQADSCVVKPAANNNWLVWLSGGSRSTRYQFIDLFELVYASKEKNTQSVLSTREG